MVLAKLDDIEMDKMMLVLEDDDGKRAAALADLNEQIGALERQKEAILKSLDPKNDITFEELSKLCNLLLLLLII
jgi:hypothetical protein